MKISHLFLILISIILYLPNSVDFLWKEVHPKINEKAYTHKTYKCVKQNTYGVDQLEKEALSRFSVSFGVLSYHQFFSCWVVKTTVHIEPDRSRFNFHRELIIYSCFLYMQLHVVVEVTTTVSYDRKQLELSIKYLI